MLSDGHSGVVLCVDAHPRKAQIASAATDPDPTIRIWQDYPQDV